MLKNERYNKLIAELGNKLGNNNIDKPFTIETYKVIQSALLAKYIKSAKVIALLDMNGFFEDAKIILRTVYEILLILLYCNLNPEEYYDRYKKHRCIVVKKYINSLSETDLTKVSKSVLENNEKEVQDYIRIYGKHNKDKWNGKSQSDTAKELSKRYNDPGIIDLFYSIYTLNCESVHSDFSSIIDSYLNISNGYGIINANPSKDLSYTTIIESLEQMSKKLDYIDFNFNVI